MCIEAGSAGGQCSKAQMSEEGVSPALEEMRPEVGLKENPGSLHMGLLGKKANPHRGTETKRPLPPCSWPASYLPQSDCRMKDSLT